MTFTVDNPPDVETLEASHETCRLRGVGFCYDRLLQSIGGKQSNKTHRLRGTGFYNPETGRKGGKIGGTNSQKTHKERGIGFYNHENQRRAAHLGGKARAKPFALMSPSGDVYIGENLSEFCRHMQLPYSSIKRCWAEKREIMRGPAKGWSAGNFNTTKAILYDHYDDTLLHHEDDSRFVFEHPGGRPIV